MSEGKQRSRRTYVSGGFHVTEGEHVCIRLVWDER
jgi:hypothetical protein